MNTLEAKKIFSKSVNSDNNEAALTLSRQLFYTSQKVLNNSSIEGSFIEETSIKILENEEFVIPKNCEFFCNDVRNLNEKLSFNNQFDFILMDPPWWNKSIRRKKAKFIESR